MPPGVPTAPKIGSGGGFGGASSFLGSQNLPGQTLGSTVGGGGGGGGIPQFGRTSNLFDPRQHSAPPGAGFNFFSGNFTGQAQGPPTSNSSGAGQAGVQHTGNVVSGISATGQAANPFTNPNLFSPETIAGLNSGDLLFSGRNGLVPLTGMFGPPQQAPQAPVAQPPAPINNPFQQGNGATGLNQQTLQMLLRLLGGQ